MLSAFLSTINFSSPLLLLAILSLPLLWWLLKLTPPKPRTIHFGGTYFLKDLDATTPSSHSIPLWLLLLRLSMITLFIIAFAAPNKKETNYQPADTPLIIVINNDWASNPYWYQIKQQASLLLKENLHYKSDVFIVTTSSPKIEPISRSESIEKINALRPQAYPSDYKATLSIFKNYDFEERSTIFYLNNNITHTHEKPLLNHLKNKFTDLTIFNTKTDKPLYWLSQSDADLTIQRTTNNNQKDITLLFRDKKNKIIASHIVTFEKEAYRQSVTLDFIPQDKLKYVEKIEIDQQNHAASVYWHKRNDSIKRIGLLANNSDFDQVKQNYLSPYLYIEKALSPYHDITKGDLETLITQSDILILTDSRLINEEKEESVLQWIEQGGIFIRFADSYLAQDISPTLTPVKIRNTDRDFDTVLSWQTPQKLAPFKRNTPFSHLNARDDIVVSKQILAEPSLTLADNSLATLDDGTPVITATQKGNGWLVLYHINATPEWSNLPLSGLFIEQLRVLTDLSTYTQKSSLVQNNTTFKLKEYLEANGNLKKASSTKNALLKLPLEKTFYPSKQLPAGTYTNDHHLLNINLGDYINRNAIKDTSPSNIKQQLYKDDLNIHYKPYLIALACLIFLIDMIHLCFTHRKIIVLLLGIVFLSTPTLAEQDILKATSASYIGYIKTGDKTTDELSKKGIEGLIKVLSERTSADVEGSFSIDLEQDSLTPFPLIYWPIIQNASAYPSVLSSNTIKKIEDYINHGGMILIDTKDQYQNTNQDVMTYGRNTQILQRLFAKMSMPPFETLPETHTLTRSFYLLQVFPGLYTNGGLWIARTDTNINDNVTPLLIGGNDWASAWALDNNHQPLIPINEANSDRQRELSYRFGINLILYALTGNYKQDQLHIPFILERLEH